MTTEPERGGSPTSPPCGRAFAPGALLVTAVVAALALLPLRQPEAPVGDFDREATARAMEHVRAMAREPHPAGTPEHARVRDYLKGRISENGLAPEEQRTTVLAEASDGSLEAATVHNVTARLPGRGDGPAVLLVAHYDSVSDGPGAADNAAAVAVLLETLRILADGPEPERDVIFLFSDAEELGLLGARAFVRDNPLQREIGLVLNFEARGASGPVLMFQSLEGSADWIRRLRDSPRPVAYSFSRDVYPLLGKDTDLSAFRDRGLLGLNFAFIEGFGAYHTSLDTPRALSVGSLSHHGGYALDLARNAAMAEDAAFEPAASELAFFTLPGAGLVLHPLSWMVPLAVLLLLATLGLTVLAVRRGTVTGGHLAIALPGVPFVILLGAGVAVTLHRLLWVFLNRTADMIASPALYCSGAMLLAGGVVVWILRRREPATVACAALLWWSVAALAAALLSPSSSYLLVWPGLAAAAGFAVHLRAAVRRPGRGTPAAACWLILALYLPILLFWAPTLDLLIAGFGAGGVLSVSLAVGLLVCLTALTTLPMSRLGNRHWVAVAAMAAGVVVVVGGSVTAEHDSQRPRGASLFYALDSETGDALWATFDRKPGDWAAGYLGEDPERRELGHFFGGRERNLLAAPAPSLPLPPPQVRATRSGPGEVELRVVSPRAAPVLNLELRSRRPFRVLAVNGRSLPAAANPADGDAWRLRYYAPPPEGLTVSLGEVAAPVEATLIDWNHSLPAETGARPAPSHVEAQTFTMVRHVAELRPDESATAAAETAEGSLTTPESPAP